ncbi:hypothetical protein SESBI_35217 [Sesbania bispinosa]|nr:hypothetical protein SESBI_35217 [Sesbania bispinosa]
MYSDDDNDKMAHAVDLSDDDVDKILGVEKDNHKGRAPNEPINRKVFTPTGTSFAQTERDKLYGKVEKLDYTPPNPNYRRFPRVKTGKMKGKRSPKIITMVATKTRATQDLMKNPSVWSLPPSFHEQFSTMGNYWMKMEDAFQPNLYPKINENVVRMKIVMDLLCGGHNEYWAQLQSKIQTWWQMAT